MGLLAHSSSMIRVCRAHSFVLDLSPAQREQVEKLARGRRDAYNFALALDREIYAADLSPADWTDLEPGWEMPDWNEARRLSPWELNKVWPQATPALYPTHPAPGQPCQLAFTDMDAARTAAVKCKRGFPRFRSRYDPHQTVSFAQGIKIEGERIKIPSIKTPLRIGGSTRRLRWFLDQAEGTIQKATLVRNGVHAPWRCVVVIEIEVPDLTAPDDRPVVGLDLGIKTFLTLSDGTAVENLCLLEHALKRLQAAQKSVSRSEQDRRAKEVAARTTGTLADHRCLPKSRRHLAKEMVVSRLHAQVVARRSEFHHATANMLISRYRAIGIENLNIAGMLRNHRLARRIADVGWASFLAILRYKAAAAGVEIVPASRWFASSQRCSACGKVNPAVKDLAVRQWTCPQCGANHERDLNAATNLYPTEARISTARATRLAEREVAAQKRQSQKNRAAKAAITKAAKAEERRRAKDTSEPASESASKPTPKPTRQATSRPANQPPQILAVTPTDSNARRGPVRPKGVTAVVPAVARTEKPVMHRKEARTEPVERRDVPVAAISLGALDPPEAIPSG